jgi:hypothetical protein
VDEARNLACGEFVMDAIFEAPNRRHVAIAFEQKLPAVLHVPSPQYVFWVHRTSGLSGLRSDAHPKPDPLECLPHSEALSRGAEMMALPFF